MGCRTKSPKRPREQRPGPRPAMLQAQGESDGLSGICEPEMEQQEVLHTNNPDTTPGRRDRASDPAPQRESRCV